MKTESVLLLMQRATHATLRGLGSDLADLDLTSAEINALANLADGQPRTATELGALVGARPTTLTGILDRLQRRAYVERVAHATDRRSVLIRLTAAGHQVARRVTAAIAGLEHRSLGDLSDQAVADCRRVLTALAEVTP